MCHGETRGDRGPQGEASHHRAVDTLGTLYDHSGQRLATDDGGSDGGFGLVKVLAPGRYFLRIEASEGAEGPSQLAFATERF